MIFDEKHLQGDRLFSITQVPGIYYSIFISLGICKAKSILEPLNGFEHGTLVSKVWPTNHYVTASFLNHFFVVEAIFGQTKVNRINPFLTTCLFLYPPLKTSENLRFSGVCRGYRRRLVA